MTSWIPIEERKPAKFGRYLTGQVVGSEHTAWYLPKYDTWIDDRRKEIRPSHWMDLPISPTPPGSTDERHAEIVRMVEETSTDIDVEYCLKHNFYLDGPGPIELTGDEKAIAREGISTLLKMTDSISLLVGGIDLLDGKTEKLKELLVKLN